MKDIVEFSKELQINTPRDGVIDFDPYPFQQNILEELVDNDFNIIWKARQMGISTIEMIYSFYEMVRKVDRNILFVSPSLDMSKAITEKLRLMYNGKFPKKMPSYYQAMYLELYGGSTFKVESEHAIHDMNIASLIEKDEVPKYSLIIFDEAAFMNDLEGLYNKCYMHMLRNNGKMLITSTKNKNDDFFMTLFKDSLRMLNEFNPILVDYEVHPKYDGDWKERHTEILGKKAFEREFGSW